MWLLVQHFRIGQKSRVEQAFRSDRHRTGHSGLSGVDLTWGLLLVHVSGHSVIPAALFVQLATVGGQTMIKCSQSGAGSSPPQWVSSHSLQCQNIIHTAGDNQTFWRHVGGRQMRTDEPKLQGSHNTWLPYQGERIRVCKLTCIGQMSKSTQIP